MFTVSQKPGIKAALFAGGCFWCMEHPFDSLPGVIEVLPGYAGGHTPDPTYDDVCTGRTGHKEVVQVTYDPAIIGYADLLKVFWRNVDPFDARGQFCDKGSQYTAAVFPADETERSLAEQSKHDHEKALGRTVVTEILPPARFYPAEGYHHGYYRKKAERYDVYRSHSGRDERLAEVWEGKKR